MKLFNLPVLAILSFTSSFVYADPPPRCSSTNYVDGNPREALRRIEDLCTPIAGLYLASRGKVACMDMGSIAYEYSVYNMDDTDRYLDHNICVGFLLDLIKCRKGGVRTTDPSHWHFRITPKAEACRAILK